MHYILALSALPLLALLAQALKITTNTNRQTGNIEVLLISSSDVGLFSVGPETLGQDEFSFSITIEPEDASEGGGTQWGLVQNIIHSTRLSTYGDNFINARPAHEPPILDGGSDIIPFFDSASFDTLDDGGSLTLTITDGPNIETVQPLYLSNVGPDGITAALSSFNVDETFRITLVQKQPDGSFTPFYQCDWSYSYTFTTLQNGATTVATASPCQTSDAISQPIVQGPVATDGAFRQYNPAGNSDFNEVRFINQENPTPTPIAKRFYA